MAHLWNVDDSGQWVATPVGDALTLLSKALDIVDASLADVHIQEHVLLRRLANPPETWALLCPPASDLRVNGEPMTLGMAVLADRDELRIPGQPPRFFSTETIAVVEALPESEGRCFCPRCRTDIVSGCEAVRCPGCGLWHHASLEMQCWTYAPTCAGCAQDTSPDAGFLWTPEDL